MRSSLKLTIAAIAAAAIVAAIVLLPVAQWLVTSVEWVRAQGAAGPLVFAALYIAAAVLFLPGSILTIGGGFLYGPLLGLALVSPVSVIAATTCFLLARSVARGTVARRLGRNPRLAAIDAGVGSSGFKLVLLLRLSPLLPFNVLNYLLGLTRVRLRDFVFGSWIGMLPGTALYVYIGSLITAASELASGERPSSGLAGQVLLVLGLLATLVVTVVLTRIARKALKETLAENESSEEPA